MNFSFDKIKYLFQIPLEWFKNIHERIFNAYGTNFITVKQGYYNGLEVGIDEETFSSAVNEVVNIPDLPTSFVTSVNGQDGDVDLGPIVNTVNGIEPTNGNVNVTFGSLPDVQNITSFDIAFVNDVYWDGTKIVIESVTLHIANGLVDGYTTNNNRYINTVQYNP